EAYRVRLESEARRAREEAIRSDHERAERYRGELAKALEEFREGARRRLAALDDKRDSIRLDKERARREAEIRRDFERLARAGAPAPSGSGADAAGSKPAPGMAGRGAADQRFTPVAGGTGRVGPHGREGRTPSTQGDPREG